MANKILKILFILTILPIFSFSQEEIKNKLENYAIEIATNANPIKAKEFISDSNFINDAMDINEELTSKLISYSQAILDLNEYVSSKFEPSDFNKINTELTNRMDINKPLCEVNICPEPEKLIIWIDKYKKFPEDKKEIFEKAIRKWEVVFGTSTDKKIVEWAQAGSMLVKKQDWDKMVLRERNAIIEKLPYSGKTEDRDFIQYNQVLDKNLNERDLTFNAAKQIIQSGVLSKEQVSSLSGKSFNEQLYILGQYFDGSNISSNPELKPLIERIQAVRYSNPEEVMNTEQREMLSKMLSTSLPSEIRGTKAGDRILNFYKGKQPKISVEYCSDCYSKEEDGKIIIDASMIEQYMRVKGYKAEELFKDKLAVDDITRYVSPSFIQAATYQMINKDLEGKYNPSLQEKGSTASAMQALYMSEKFSKDSKYKDIFTQMSPISDYAGKVVVTHRTFQNEGTKDFMTSIEKLYYSSLPSAKSVTSQVLFSINQEIERRNSLTEKEKKEIDDMAILSKSEINSMGLDDFTLSVREMKTEDLIMIREEMLSNLNPDTYYRNFARNIRKDFLKVSSSTKVESKVPMPKSN